MEFTERPNPNVENVQQCITLLESFLENRELLATLSDEQRKALMTAAGRVSHPDKVERAKLANALRRSRKRKDREKDRASRESTGIREARRATVFSAPSATLPPPEKAPKRELTKPRHCYVCKEDFRELHFFYDTMCPSCAELNYRKRFQTASLEGRVALITGARVKIGYQAALMMLRAGARVIVSTRFPRDAARRYAREADFAIWGDRLSIHGLDLRHSPSVELFCRYVTSHYDRLDILINNAAQTVRRPPGWYRHLLELETGPVSLLTPEERSLLEAHERFRQNPALPVPGTADSRWLSTWEEGAKAIGVTHSAKLSQIPYDYEDRGLGREVFPEGKLDADLQQVDLRGVNSWRLPLAEVPTAEMLEVQLVNSVAPFILCGKLKPLMTRDRTNEKHIVNVTAMEGIFSRHTKTDKHPHTNMAKAALNMMTLTAAPDYAKDGIFMNAVDTGWVTDEDPLAISLRKQAELDFQPPLDIVDGAARICDPFFSGLLTGNHQWGKFFKDYRPSAW